MEEFCRLVAMEVVAVDLRMCWNIHVAEYSESLFLSDLYLKGLFDFVKHV